MVSAGRANDANMFTVQSAAKVSSLEKQMKVTMLTTLYGELVKNLELSKTMAAREEPLITIIDRPHYPLRVRESGLKGPLWRLLRRIPDGAVFCWKGISSRPEQAGSRSAEGVNFRPQEGRDRKFHWIPSRH